MTETWDPAADAAFERTDRAEPAAAADRTEAMDPPPPPSGVGAILIVRKRPTVLRKRQREETGKKIRKPFSSPVTPKTKVDR